MHHRETQGPVPRHSYHRRAWKSFRARSTDSTRHAGPTMKTLTQVEPRTPIPSAPFTINSSRSYDLTNNMSVSSGDAITIAANSVTLDLNGFTISSTAPGATGTGILISGNPRNITISNGFIEGAVIRSGGTFSGNGFANGIFFDRDRHTSTCSCHAYR